MSKRLGYSNVSCLVYFCPNGTNYFHLDNGFSNGSEQFNGITFVSLTILGGILSEMEGLQFGGQHMGARRESRLSRFDFGIRGKSKERREGARSER